MPNKSIVKISEDKNERQFLLKNAVLFSENK
jgi:hypothetical protein